MLPATPRAEPPPRRISSILARQISAVTPTARANHRHIACGSRPSLLGPHGPEARPSCCGGPPVYGHRPSSVVARLHEFSEIGLASGARPPSLRAAGTTLREGYRETGAS